jgi:allantoicase
VVLRLRENSAQDTVRIDKKHFFNLIKSICTKVSTAWSESSETQQAGEQKSFLKLTPEKKNKPNRLHKNEFVVVPTPTPPTRKIRKEKKNKETRGLS